MIFNEKIEWTKKLIVKENAHKYINKDKIFEKTEKVDDKKEINKSENGEGNEKNQILKEL